MGNNQLGILRRSLRAASGLTPKQISQLSEREIITALYVCETMPNLRRDPRDMVQVILRAAGEISNGQTSNAND